MSLATMTTELYIPPGRKSSGNSLRISNHPAIYREQLKKESQERKRSILHLILKYLLDHNLNVTADALQTEAQIGTQHKVCDNVDLDIILQEYQSYYYTKFQRDPHILRPNEDTTTKEKCKSSGNAKIKPVVVQKKNEGQPQQENGDPFKFKIKSLAGGDECHSIVQVEEFKLMPVLCDFENYSAEWREMADEVMRQVVPKNLGVSWADCVGLGAAVELIKEAVVYPLQYPELFRSLQTWRGILLYGPPGTGKTLLAKALACEAPVTFFNVTSSVFTSKWRGDSEKMLKVLFDVAKLHSPSVIFIDEIDSLTGSNEMAKHEASRRFKSEFLIQIDGILKTKEVFVLTTTNVPWAVDPAMLRRFEKRILVPLPDENVREQIFRYYLESDEEVEKEANKILPILAKSSVNFSGCDVKTACKESQMRLVREKLAAMKINSRLPHQEQHLRKLTCQDVMDAIVKVRPCVDEEFYKKYIDWDAKYGSLL